MYIESDLLPHSSLQHLAYCERQWGLIHLEKQWAENRLTAEGHILHERADSAGSEFRGGIRVARGVAIRSLHLGVTGKADVVEFHRASYIDASDGKQTPSAVGTPLPDVEGLWHPVPVEYKRGRPKVGPYDEIQVGAQALCLEEMLGTSVPKGFLYYGRNRRRTEVLITDELRQLVERTAFRLHELMSSGLTPAAVYDRAKCDRCSMLGICMPKNSGRRVRAYIDRSLGELLAEEEG